jgi:hypothetical protein
MEDNLLQILEDIKDGFYNQEEIDKTIERYINSGAIWTKDSELYELIANELISTRAFLTGYKDGYYTIEF